MHNTLLHQYQFILGSRKALFNYCEGISTDKLLTPLASFNNESIITQLTHVANCYVFWLAHYAMQDQRPFFRNEDQHDLYTVKQAFEQVNILVNDFLHRFSAVLDVPVTLPRKGDLVTTTPLQVFTHVTTHEFHHKGQAVNMSRQLGYIPVDTDVITY